MRAPLVSGHWSSLACAAGPAVRQALSMTAAVRVTPDGPLPCWLMKGEHAWRRRPLISRRGMDARDMDGTAPVAAPTLMRTARVEPCDPAPDRAAGARECPGQRLERRPGPAGVGVHVRGHDQPQVARRACCVAPRADVCGHVHRHGRRAPAPGVTCVSRGCQVGQICPLVDADAPSGWPAIRHVSFRHVCPPAEPSRRYDGP
jgi:hypothetical protein